jgi:hypothetical protein
MMDEASCRVLIDTVYEPHYAHYKDDFGNTIAGFFSDEPEFGNGHLYAQDNALGTDQDLPWSAELGEWLRREWGEDYAVSLPLLWENGVDPGLTARIRYGYMDAVTRLVEKDFSLQVGGWCRAHGVEYIGHIIEDNNQHARTGSSLGHFFRSMAGQDMSGIDDIGGQVFPQGEDDIVTGQLFGNRDGEFYHYVLAKLGSSFASINPAMKGRAMCEIFGNYGWACGVLLEKYLADHFMVRGVNRFVPHAFSPKAFPDPDCPPHFYAHGHNPQYRHFSVLMAYMNRVCALISGGKILAPVAVLYHGEAEWVGGDYMLTQKPCHILADNQIDYEIIPQDVFSEPERYKTEIGKTLKINSQEYSVLVVPTASYITVVFAKAVAKLRNAGFPVVFINDLPKGLCDYDNLDDVQLIENLKNCPVATLDNLIPFLREQCLFDIIITPADNRIRYLRYAHDDGLKVCYFINEGTGVYRGTITVPENGPCAAYNAWNNYLETIEAKSLDTGTALEVEIEPLKSLIVIFYSTGFAPGGGLRQPLKLPEKKDTLQTLTNGWKRSCCKSIEYPHFTGEKEINLPDNMTEEQPDFSGFVRYEKTFRLDAERTDTGKPLILEITDAHEGVEVFVNGVSAGIQITPPFRYDISTLVNPGDNKMVIEVATTLERERYAALSNPMEKMRVSKPVSHLGISGQVFYWQ